MKTSRFTKSATFVRSSVLHFREVGAGKLVDYRMFLAEYRRVTRLLLDHYWESGLVHSQGEFSIPKEKYDMPLMLTDADVPEVQTTLSGRALKCLTTQLSGLIRAEIEKYRRLHWTTEKYGRTAKRDALIKQGPRKPDVSKIKIELNSICSDMELTPEGHFDSFISLKSFTNTAKGVKINLPVIIVL